MSSRILDLLYAFVLILATPWLLYRLLVQRKPVAGWRTKLSGAVPLRNTDRPCVWFHAVSVGEVLQLKRLIAEFRQHHSEYDVVISTTTGTGFAVAHEQFPQHQIIYWPFDFSWAVSRAFQRLQPRCVVLVELEVWPNFLRAAERLHVPVCIVNGRISPRSFRGYLRLRPWLAPLFRTLAHVGTQTEEYRERFAALGVPADRLTVTGNLKYDRVQSLRDNPATQQLKAWAGLASNDLVFIAGSTQAPEERIALEVFESLSADFPQLRLLLVPRHRERFEEVARLIVDRGHPLRRRSQTTAHHEDRPVLLLDTLGELAACWGLADIAFVGGSLGNRGGQNMLEPAGYGAAVLFGPNTTNFRDAVEALLNRRAALVVRDPDELRESVRRLILDEASRQQLGLAAQAFVLTQQGATARTLCLLERYVSPSQRRKAA